MKNFSRQREAILNVLHSTDVHPTAGWVYERVRETIPNISLGTVYRNLAELTRSGEILSLSVGDGYAHLHCRICGSIEDAELESDSLADAARCRGFTPDTSVYIAYGVCAECNSKKEKQI